MEFNAMLATPEDDVFSVKRCQALEVEWQVNNYFNLTYYHHLDSPTFEFSGAEWKMRVYPQQLMFESECIRLLLVKKRSPSDIQLSYALGVKKADGSILESFDRKDSFRKEGDAKGDFYLLDHPETFLPINVSTDDRMKLYCALRLPKEEDTTASVALEEAASKNLFSDVIKNSQEKREKLKELSRKIAGDSEAYRHSLANIVNRKTEEQIKVFQEEMKGLQEESKFPVLRKKYEDSRANIENWKTGIEKWSENLKELYLSGSQGDFKFIVKNKEFVIHKLILSARSPVFRSMFEHDMEEKNSGSVNIEDCDPESFNDFLLFIYSGKLDVVSVDNAIGLYSTADKYDFQDLKEACSQCLTHGVSMETVCDVVQLATLHDDSNLLKAATDFFVENVDKILKTAKWQPFLVEHHTLANELFIKAISKYKK